MKRRHLGENPLAFKTPGGSHLYGLTHIESDFDWTFVHTEKMDATTLKTGNMDVSHLSVFDMLEKAYRGVPLAIEAVFSQHKVWYDQTYRSMIEGVRVPPAAARPTYMKLIENFVNTDTQKARQHAVRLALNLRTLSLFDGWTNPSLTGREISEVVGIATEYNGQPLLDKIEELLNV